MIELKAFPAQQGVQPRQSELAPLFRQFSQAIPDLIIVLGLRLIAASTPQQPNNFTSPPLTD